MDTPSKESIATIIIGSAEELANVQTEAPAIRVVLPISDLAALEFVKKSVSDRQALHAAPPGQEYVDPYLFETGHFESREEYEELSRTTKIKPRARA